MQQISGSSEKEDDDDEEEEDEDIDPVLLAEVLPEDYVACSAPPALDARLLGQEILLKFDIGWVHVIKKETKSRGYTTPSNGMMNPLKYSSCWI